jgi:ADP-ribosylglycohydrolase
MHVCVAEVAALGEGLRGAAALDGVAARFMRWFREGASDIGNQTRQVLAAVGRVGGTSPSPSLSSVMCACAADLHARTGRSAGNGSLMRTSVVALPYLGDASAMTEAARLVSGLTHVDDLAGDACVLWCSGVRRAVLDGTFAGVREGLALLPEDRRDQWAAWLDEAENAPPSRFAPNGFVVPALQAAWSAITRTSSLPDGLAAAVSAGDDTDTVAAIAGGLLGARYGASAVPAAWREKVHGWPGLTGDDLAGLAVSAAAPPA